MNYSEAKEDIKKDLAQPNLKNPSIRLNAIENIEKLIFQEINDMLSNPIKLLEKIEKNEMKRILSNHKSNGKLNDAESSIINELYYRT